MSGTAFGLSLHSFHFQKIKKFVFLKVGDYIKTIKRSKYIDRIIELNGTPDIKIIFIDFMDLAYEKKSRNNIPYTPMRKNIIRKAKRTI